MDLYRLTGRFQETIEFLKLIGERENSLHICSVSNTQFIWTLLLENFGKKVRIFPINRNTLFPYFSLGKILFSEGLMARDLYICGMNLEGSTQRELSDSNDIISYLCSLECDDWEAHGIVKITSYRSKDICFAISQVVNDLLENGYGILEGVTIHHDLGANLMVLSKSEILSIVNWLVLTSEALGEITGNIEDMVHNNNSLYNSALEVARCVCVGEEFEWYWFEKELFKEWYRKINSTTFKYYIWDDSY